MTSIDIIDIAKSAWDIFIVFSRLVTFAAAFYFGWNFDNIWGDRWKHKPVRIVPNPYDEENDAAGEYRVLDYKNRERYASSDPYAAEAFVNGVKS
ncbi:MAG: hypothetical protein AB7O86_05925 [Porticoccaceae bacterium]